MTESKHTPIPWKVNTFAGRPNSEVFSNDTLICDCRATNVEMTSEEIEANAEFIVRAVNSHQALLDALKCLYRDEKLDDGDPALDQSRIKAAAAIKLAEEGPQ